MARRGSSGGGRACSSRSWAAQPGQSAPEGVPGMREGSRRVCRRVCRTVWVPGAPCSCPTGPPQSRPRRGTTETVTGD